MCYCMVFECGAMGCLNRVVKCVCIWCLNLVL